MCVLYLLDKEFKEKMKKPVLSQRLIELVIILVAALLLLPLNLLNPHDTKLITLYKMLVLSLLIIIVLALHYLIDKFLFPKHKDHKIIIDILKALQDNKAGEYLNLKTINHDTPKGKYCCWLLLDKGLADGCPDSTDDRGHNAYLDKITECGESYLREPFLLK